MRELVAKQIAQRKAVAASKERAIRPSGSLYGGRRVWHLVYLSGDAYVVDDWGLEALRRGEDVSDVDAQPCQDENDPFAGYA